VTISEVEAIMKVNYNYKHSEEKSQKRKKQAYWIIHYSKHNDDKIIVI